MGLNCPSLLDWECGKRAARARRYAFWASMNSANLRAVVMTWHRSGNKNNLAIGSDGSEWTTRGIGLSMTINVPVVKRAAAQQSVYSAAVTRYDQRPNRNTQRGDADSVPLRTFVCRAIREFFKGHSGRVGMVQNGAPTHEIECQSRWKQGGGMVDATPAADPLRR